MSGGVDLERLVKLMRMTESAHDGESLNALRLANKMLRAAGKHWGDVLVAGSTSSDDYRTAPSKRRGFNSKPSTAQYGSAAPRQKYDGHKGRNEDPEIRAWLEALNGRRHSIDFQMFLGSVTEFYENNGYLTDAQYSAVKRAFEYR